jgi:hypothetical protein
MRVTGDKKQQRADAKDKMYAKSKDRQKIQGAGIKQTADKKEI